jgi:hypothetical protein
MLTGIYIGIVNTIVCIVPERARGPGIVAEYGKREIIEV